MYIVCDKVTKRVIFDHPGNPSKKLEGKEIYPNFDSATMDILKSDLSFTEIKKYYHNILGNFNIDNNGNLKEKTIEEKIESKSINFGKDLLKYIDDSALQSENIELKIVELGIEFNLIKSANECCEALSKIDNEIENNITKKYTHGQEIKILKAYNNWVTEGKPANDKRETGYLTMESDIKSIKQPYKSVRDQIKQIKSNLESQT